MPNRFLIMMYLEALEGRFGMMARTTNELCWRQKKGAGWGLCMNGAEAVIGG